MCCPEFNVCMLHFGVMAGDEVVVVRNTRRFSTCVSPVVPEWAA